MATKNKNNYMFCVSLAHFNKFFLCFKVKFGKGIEKCIKPYFFLKKGFLTEK